MAEFKLQAEIKQQNEEAERRALANAMFSDAKANRVTFNTSNAKLLRNYHSNIIYFRRYVISRKNIFFFLYFFSYAREHEEKSS